jgi:hypothetical protein
MKSLLVRLGVILIGLIIFSRAEVRGVECAWVLWTSQNWGDNMTGAWTIDSAFPNYELCIKELNNSLNDLKARLATTPRSKLNSFKNGFSVDLQPDKTGKEKHFQFLFMCLPDTIDPRK